MPLYEHVFLARNDLSTQQVDALVDKFTGILSDNGGKVVNKEYWGLKPLAYRIKKNRKAHYGFLQLDTPHEAVAEMERQMNLTNDVLRFMTIRVDNHDSLPSVMMRKSDRDDRRPRRGGGRFEGPREGGRDDRRADNKEKRENAE